MAHSFGRCRLDPPRRSGVHFGARGHQVEQINTGNAAVEYAPDADIVLLGMNLPDLNGIEVCRRIRQRSRVPIVMFSDVADEAAIVLSLSSGADDYIVKPCGSLVLLARVTANARRAIWCREPNESPPESRIILGALSIRPRARQVVIDGREVTLTLKEFDLLVALAEEPGIVMRRNELIARVWDENWIGSTRTLDVHISALRTKLDRDGLIETIRGVGFRLDSSRLDGHDPSPRDR
ncbi:response regulator transcription factor [Phytohabitans flavus]|uniref:response regulator transcription factor n=1 Tax=Phytohabitans flavus TaxID=1076124 RepID=UPI00362B74B4